MSKNLVLTHLNCKENQLTSLDVSKNTALTELYCYDNQLTSLNVSECTALDFLDCSYNQLTSFDVSKNTALMELRCAKNQLTSIDVSNNTALTELYCYDNQLTSLDVSKNMALTYLWCNDNQLTSLDVSKNMALTFLYCYDNKIKGEAMDALVGSLPNQVSAEMRVIDLSNSSEENVCISIQVKTAKEKGWRVLTSSGDLYVGCDTSPTDIIINKENFPDANFRNFLLNEPYGKDGIITNEEILSVTYLGIGGRWIKDLKGIEFFTALEMLHCNNNYLTSLNVSKNTALTYLDCYSNQLTSIDVSKNTALTNLNCCFNQLTSLDVSICTALTELYIGDNQLTSLDVSKNLALTELSCFSNQLTSLDVSINSALTYLDCEENLLTSIDVSKNTALTQLYSGENQLTNIDVSNNTALTKLACEGNQLTSLDVSNNTALTLLHCYENQLTSLDVSRNTALTYLFCYNNKIKGEAMDALVGSLPNQASALMRVIDLSNSSEENVCTSIQVNTAKEKGWRVLTSSGEDYEGSDQTLDENLSGSCGDGVNYTYEKANHTLTISGKGAIFDYDNDSNKAPWSYCADEIQKIEIESGITSIGYFTFYKCSGITSLSIPATVGYIGSSAFEDCTSLTSLSLNEGLLSIGGSAFESCIGLQTLSIPSTVNTISINAFKNCKGITDVYCYAENVPDTHFDAFDGTPTEKSTLHVPAKAVEAYRVSWPWSDFKEIVSIDADAIMGVKLSDDRNGDYYDLTGRRVLHPQKGIYIRNSKKVIVR